MPDERERPNTLFYIRTNYSRATRLKLALEKNNVKTNPASKFCASPQIFLVAILGQICLKFVFQMSSPVIGRARG